MILIDRLRIGLVAERRGAWRASLPSASLDEHAPVLVALAVGGGLMLLILATPTASGDYGQWLMTSRYYLGQGVPDYRAISSLPPLVPLLLTAIRLVVPDPLVALHLLDALLLAALGASFYLLGALVLGSRWAGALSVVIGLFVTDRFLELFAFGGLLQVAAMACMGLSVAAFARAGRGPGIVRRWWVLGTVAVAMAALSHTATGLLAVAVALVVAGLAAVARRELGWRRLALVLAPLGIVMVGIAVYWTVVLLPANSEYISNPASLAYRGPDRLFGPLIGQWPNAALLVLGGVALALGGLRALRARRLDGYVVLLAWVTVTWGALIYSMLTATRTDYPRFATPLLAPIVVGASAGALWLLKALASSIRNLGYRWPPNALIATVVLGGVLVATPTVVARHGQQADYYDLRDATALRTAVTWIDESLGANRTAVLTDVREGKWVEGLTGREALFSQPVRYAFRQTEWQRSVDADTLLRSTTTLTNGLIGAFFTDAVTSAGRTAPAGLVVRANHGGELLDLLRLPWADTTIVGDHATITANRLVPVRVKESASTQQVSVSTVWADRSRTLSLTQSVTVWRDSAAMRLTQWSPGNQIQLVLRPPRGVAITSFASHGQEANVCFTQFGDSQPCLRIWVSQSDATMSHGSDGVLRVATRDSDRLNLLVTALTAGAPSVGLGLLHPGDLVESRKVGAALLYAADPGYLSRAQRLEAIGFRDAFAAGPYRVLLRDRFAIHPAGGGP
jgi:hypothetical protein